jgi:DNA polymerase-3 subunit delta'
VVAGVHPDLYVVEGQVKIGDPGGSGFHEDEATARDIVRQLSMHSYAGGKRIVILGDADFTREAANALLKFFEEPAGDVIVIVTSSTPGRLLATIRSRLIEVLFAARPETKSVDPEAGALRDAAAEWFLAAARGAETDASWATRPTLEDGLTTIKTLARDWLALAVAGDAAPLLARDRTADLRALPPRDPVALVRTLASIGDAERIARTNVTPALVAELVRMALAPSR